MLLTLIFIQGETSSVTFLKVVGIIFALLELTQGQSRKRGPVTTTDLDNEMDAYMIGVSEVGVKVCFVVQVCSVYTIIVRGCDCNLVVF